jgi:hypothetical protein
LTGPQGIQGIQGIQGVKGDAGGIVMGPVLDATNANTVTTPGVYRLYGAGNITTALNWPQNGTMETAVVFVTLTASDWITQEVLPIGAQQASRVTYRRSMRQGIWSGWYATATSRVDQTAGRVIYQWDDTNNREQIIYGDTGWRDVTTSITAPFTCNGLRLRRNLNRVTIQWDSLTSGPSAAPTGSAFTAPAGFTVSNRDPSYYGRAVLQQAANSVGNIWSYGWNSASLIPQQCIGSWFNGVYFNGGFTYLTDDPWPTTLPGTALGTIPNS